MIQKLLTIAKGLPWWAWVLVGLAVLYVFNMASGLVYCRKLWNMLHDEILKEDKAIQEELEKEVTRLDQREKELIQENARISQQLASAQEEKRVLLGRLHEIETSFPQIMVFSNLSPLADQKCPDARRPKSRGVRCNLGTPQRRGMRETQQMVVFHQPSKKRRYIPIVLPRK